MKITKHIFLVFFLLSFKGAFAAEWYRIMAEGNQDQMITLVKKYQEINAPVSNPRVVQYNGKTVLMVGPYSDQRINEIRQNLINKNLDPNSLVFFQLTSKPLQIYPQLPVAQVANNTQLLQNPPSKTTVDPQPPAIQTITTSEKTAPIQLKPLTEKEMEFYKDIGACVFVVNWRIQNGKPTSTQLIDIRNKYANKVQSVSKEANESCVNAQGNVVKSCVANKLSPSDKAIYDGTWQAIAILKSPQDPNKPLNHEIASIAFCGNLK